MFKLLIIALVTGLIATPVPAQTGVPNADLVTKGEKIFRKCKACHQIGPDARNRTGPALTGIVGSKAAQAEGFRYSKAMQSAALDGLIWTPDTLANFLVSPKGYVKGTKMNFGGLRKASDVKAIIAYLSASYG